MCVDVIAPEACRQSVLPFLLQKRLLLDKRELLIERKDRRLIQQRSCIGQLTEGRWPYQVEDYFLRLQFEKIK